MSESEIWHSEQIQHFFFLRIEAELVEKQVDAAKSHYRISHDLNHFLFFARKTDLFENQSHLSTRKISAQRSGFNHSQLAAIERLLINQLKQPSKAVVIHHILTLRHTGTFGCRCHTITRANSQHGHYQ